MSSSPFVSYEGREMAIQKPDKTRGENHEKQTDSESVPVGLVSSCGGWSGVLNGSAQRQTGLRPEFCL
jgi:hypothetical protein